MRTRILVVEDNPSLAALFELTFDPARYEIALAADFTAARKTLTRRPPDLVILDLLLTGGNGLNFCRELKATWPSSPVLILATLPHPSARDASLAAGADDFLPKPFGLDELEAAVERLLGAGVDVGAAAPFHRHRAS